MGWVARLHFTIAMATSPQPGTPVQGFSASASNLYRTAGQQQPPAVPGLNCHYDEVSSRSIPAHSIGVVSVLAVFSLLVFVALLFLYSRWAGRYRHMAPSPAAALSGGSAAVLSNTTGEPVTQEAMKFKNGLTEEVINMFPMVPVNRRTTAAAGGDELQCSICLGGLMELMKVLPVCGHGFHSQCVDPWLRLHASCPLCRASLRQDPLQAV